MSLFKKNKLEKSFDKTTYFLKGISKPFRKLGSSLRKKWKRSSKLVELKDMLRLDVTFMIHEIIENGIGERYTMVGRKRHSAKIIKEQDGSFTINYPALNINNYFMEVVDESVLKDLKVIELLEKVQKTKRGEGFEQAIQQMLESYLSKIDKRVSRYIIKQENLSFVDLVEYDEESSISKSEYKKKKIELQIELVKLQEWAVANKKKIAIVFEGRDAAGKGSSIKRFTEYINPKHYRVVALGIPTKEESENWFQRYEEHLPKEGEIVFFDRSWYNRAVVEPTMDYCTEEQYERFMDNVVEWENNMIDDDVILIKFWFSVDQEKQLERFELRKKSPLKHWKFSPNDEKTVSKWDVMTKYKEQMFEVTSTNKSPWVVVNSNDKRVSRLNSIRYVLSKMEYTGKDNDKELIPSSDVVKELN